MGIKDTLEAWSKRYKDKFNKKFLMKEECTRNEEQDRQQDIKREIREAI